MLHDSETLVDDDRRAAAPEPLRQGGRLGRYVILQELGHGGMGVVFAAYDPELDRKVAVKLLRRMAGRGSIGQRRLVREAQAMARLSHPNVITVHDVGTHGDDGDVYVAMEFIAGRTLGAWMKAEHTRAEILAVLLAAGRGLAAAHDKGLVHRDFKPDNVMIADEDGRVRVMDFGLARAQSQSEPADELRASLPDVGPEDPSLATDLTREGAVVGTPAYMAPEQLRGAEVDARADQFAFCVVLYEALYGERPFAGDTLAHLAANLSSGDVRPAPAGAVVPSWLRRVVVRGLSVDPDARWPSMRALMTALQRDPTRTRRRWATGIAGIALVGGAFGGLALERAHQAHGCAMARAEVEAVWNDHARADLAMGFAKTQSPLAADAAERAAIRLDDYAARWGTVRGQVCREEHVDGTRDAQSHALAARCLDAQSDDLQQMLAMLADADGPTVVRAVELVTSLPPPESCLDVAPETGANPPPPELRRELTNSHLLAAVGRFDDARDAAQRALDQADAADLDAPRIEAQRRLGGVLYRLGELQAATDILADAMFAAQRIGRDDLAAECATVLVGLASSRGERLHEGLLWARLAEATYDRIGEGETERRGDLASNLGNLQDTLGDTPAAVRSHERALMLFRNALGEDHPRVAGTMTNLGNALLHAGRYDEARQFYEAALEQTKAIYGPQHPDTASCLENLANTRILAGRPQEAIGLMQQSLDIRHTVLPAHHPKTGNSHYNLGNALIEAGRIDEAYAQFQAAREIYEHAWGPEHADVAHALEGLALVAHYRRDVAKAVELQRRAVAIYDATLEGSPRALVNPLVNLGEAEREAGDLEAAEATLARATEIATDVYAPDDPQLASLHSIRGAVATARGDHTRAVTEARRGLAIADAAGLGSESARIRLQLAKALVRAGADLDEARALATAARDALREADDEVELAEAEAVLVELDELSPAAPDR